MGRQFDTNMLASRAIMPFVKGSHILPHWWHDACGNAGNALDERSIAQFVRDLFDDWHLVWGIFPDAKRPGKYTGLLLQGGSYYTRDEHADEWGISAWHCRNKNEAKWIAAAFSRDCEVSAMVSENARIGSVLFTDHADLMPRRA